MQAKSMKRIALWVCFLAVTLSGCSLMKRNRSMDEMDSLVLMPPLSMSATRGVVEAAPSATADTPPLAEPEQAMATPEAVVETVETYAYRLQVGDPVVIHLRGIYPRDEMIEDIVDDGGNVTLPHLGDIYALGKSTSQIEADIRKRYIDGKIYNTITVNVVMPQRTYFIQGEVRQPGRYQIVGGMTMMQAIAAAGGYTVFASPRKVILSRGGTKREINMRKVQRNPEEDIRLESGDVIVVERSMF
jgi:protein involved in polysaccharide export with SLBB domain